MIRPLLLDTTALITALRDAAHHQSLCRQVATRRCYLTTITVAELHAGARSRAQQAAVAELVAAFARLDRLLVPTPIEWERAGRLIAHARWRKGDMEPRDHYPDVLIAQIADRLGAMIVTANQSDFRTWISLGRLDATVQGTND